MFREMLLIICLGSMQITSYQSLPAQTKGRQHTKQECLYTSIGERCNVHGCAVSQDLLKAGVVHYGDLLYIENIGFKFVNDCMNARYRMHVDVWVDSYGKEKKINIRSGRVWLLKPGGEYANVIRYKNQPVGLFTYPLDRPLDKALDKTR